MNPARVLFVALLGLMAAVEAWAEECALISRPETLIDEPRRFLQSQIELDRELLWRSGLPDSFALSEFREHVTAWTNVEPFALLKRQLEKTRPGPDHDNVSMVLEGRAGRIRPMSCLEGLLLARQAERTARTGKPMFDHPTEFFSYLLRREGELKIYFYTVDQAGIGRVDVFDDLLARDLAEGWVLHSNLHNHNFFPGTANPLGATVPSANDVRAFRAAREKVGLGLASVTNGFDTVDLSGEGFDWLVPAE